MSSLSRIYNLQMLVAGNNHTQMKEMNMSFYFGMQK